MNTFVRRFTLATGVVIAIAIAWSQVALTLAAPMPKPAVGIACPTTGVVNVGDANYVVAADMVVPAGKYAVTAAGTVNNQTGAPVDVLSCNAYGGSVSIGSGTTSAPLQYAGLAIAGTIDLPTGGTIKVECISTVTSGTPPLIGIFLVAQSVAGITILP